MTWWKVVTSEALRPDGSPKPEFGEWERDQLLDLDPGTLLPVWWPREHPEDGHILSHGERVESFREELDNLLSLRRTDHTGSAPPTERILTPTIVLKSLRFLRSVYAPGDNLAPD